MISLPYKAALIYIHDIKEAKALLAVFTKRYARMLKGRKKPRCAMQKSHTHLYNLVMMKTEGEWVPTLVSATNL